MEWFKGRSAEFVNALFQTLLVTYLVLLLVEQVYPGFVSTYLNMNYMLVAVIIAGVLSVFSSHHPVHHAVTRKDYWYIALLAIAGFFIIKYKTAELGWLSWMISGIAGVLIGLLSLLILQEDDKDSPKEEYELTKQGWVFTVGMILLGLVVLSIVLEFFGFSFLAALRVVFGSVFVLFIPGFCLTFNFFSLDKIDWLERVALSFALSIAVVPLAVFYLNLVGVRINALNVTLITFGVIVLSLAALWIQHKKPHHKVRERLRRRRHHDHLSQEVSQ